MAVERIQRRLAAILATDVVGYSRLMAGDEVGTLAALRAHRKDLINPNINERGGRTVKLTGDGALVEFGSVVAAVECAMAIQRTAQAMNADRPEAAQIVFRIGINVGDVILEGEDIYGDSVNIAARLEGIAEPGGIVISEDAWRQVQGKVAASFVDLGEQCLKNIARPVRIYRVDLVQDSAKQPTVSALPVSDEPSIAVLPFRNMSGDPEQDHFCDGLVEDIITTLSKLAGLRVIARNSSFLYKARSIDVREVAKQLGVRFVLGGSVRKSGNRIRVTAQLIDAKAGAHVWAERYDRVMDDIFAIQDEITLSLATEMQVKFTEGEQARLHYTTTNNFEAWTHWVRGLSHYRAPPTKDEIGHARLCWEKALALDPTSPALNAMLGFLHCLDARFGWWDDRETAILRARAYVDTALVLEPENADAHRTSSFVLLAQERYDESVVDARKSVQLAPGSADVAEFASFVLASSGYPEEAVALIEKAVAVNPNYPAVYLGVLGNAYRLSGRIEKAIDSFEAYGARHPSFGLTDLVIAYQENRQPEEAKRAAERLLAARPDFTVTSWRKTQFRRDAERLDADVAALQATGLPKD
jgi:adenylate cyclase